MNLDFTPASILLSGIETGQIAAKGEDLGFGEQVSGWKNSHTFTDSMVVFPARGPHQSPAIRHAGP